MVLTLGLFGSGKTTYIGCSGTEFWGKYLDLSWGSERTILQKVE